MEILIRNQPILFLSVALFISFAPSLSTAAWVKRTGAWKIEEDKCLEETIVESNETVKNDWLEYDCIELIKKQNAELLILSNLAVYYNFKQSGEISEAAFEHLLKNSISLVGLSLTKEQISRVMNETIEEALKTYPIKQTKRP